MRILFIRHGDPDYANDTLTEKGHKEAALLADLAHTLQVGDCYVSPLGRARATAEYTLEKLELTARTCDWLREFDASLDINGSPDLQKAFPDTHKEGDLYHPRIVWDSLPSYFTEHPEYLDREAWRTSEVALHSDWSKRHDYVTAEFDKLLASYGYVRQGAHYRVEKENTQTITFFCHFGITAVLLAHLWNVSPYTLWHGLALAPTSVSEVVSEEREQGIACFRGLRLGDTTHLFAGGETPSFSARFCEVYSNKNQRH